MVSEISGVRDVQGDHVTLYESRDGSQVILSVRGYERYLTAEHALHLARCLRRAARRMQEREVA